MYSSNSIFKKAIDVAKGVMLLGTAVFGWGSMANAAEVAEIAGKAGPTIAKVETVKVQHNLQGVVKALGIVDPAWAKGLPRVNARKGFTDHYYEYIGDDHDNASVQDPANWSYIGAVDPGTFPCDDEQEELMCGVRLPTNPAGLTAYLTAGGGITFNQLVTNNQVETYREDPQRK